MAPPADWTDAAPLDVVTRARMLEVEPRGVAVLLYDVNGSIFATAAICPHHAAWLSDGVTDGEYVDCPRHQGRFHIPTGHQVRGPECPALRTYPVRVEGGRVLVWL